METTLPIKPAKFQGGDEIIINVPVEGRKIGYRIEEEDIGIFKVITEVGYTTELEPIGPNRTKVVWKFFHNPKGIFGHIMNRLFILRRQQKNRRGRSRITEAVCGSF